MKKKLKKTKQENSDFIDFLNDKYGTRDTDHDGLTDEVESLLGTNPYEADTDHDGMSDADEIRVGRNPLGPGGWRDWVMPHAGNNYQPHLLHPRRLVFYAAAAVVMKILVVAFVIGLPMTAWLAPDVLKEQADQIIALTNKVRAAHNAPALTENQILNRAAYAKASDMVLQQYFAHVGPDKKTLSDWLKAVGYRYAVAGENLAMGFNSAAEVVEAWKKSQTHYANLVDTDFKEIGVGAVSGPYQGATTVLVAQYFGATLPTVTTVTAVKPSNNKTAPVETKPVTSISNAAPRAEVAAVKSLAKPVIINWPGDGWTKQATTTLRIFAPLASAVNVLDVSGEVMARAKRVDQEWQTQITWCQGENQFQIVAVAGQEQAISDPYAIKFDNEAPTADAANSQLSLDLPRASREAVARASLRLSDDTAAARLDFGGQTMELTLADGQWLGQTVVGNRDSLLPLTPPSVIMTDRAGNSRSQELSWDGQLPLESSPVSRYWFARQNPDQSLAKIFGVSDWFYRLLLFGATMSLTVAVAVEIKKQKPKLIISTSGLIVLLIVLLIF